MPVVEFDALPDDARIWVFGANDPVVENARTTLLAAVDSWLAQWKAHGEPLTSARDWRDNRFLVIGVDQHTAGASGCSIDALFRVLQQVQVATGATLLGGGRLFYRDRSGTIQSIDRTQFAHASGITGDTPVFDTALTSAGEYRSHFEVPARQSWHRQLLVR